MYRDLWVREKVAIASRLYHGEAGTGYPEAVIILCAVISGLAADVWPGDRIDRARFVEALKRFVPAQLSVDLISIPLLLQALSARNVEILTHKFADFDASKILTSSDVDQTEDVVLAACPALSPKVVRKYCYAQLLYESVRSGYIHEYRLDPRAVQHPMTSVQIEPVSYVNLVGFGRQIHFHWKWLETITLSLGPGIDLVGAQLPLPCPELWWIDG